MNSRTPQKPTRLERALSALWIAAVTVLAIPALIAAFSRSPARPLPEKTPEARAAAAADAAAERARNENANRPRTRDPR